jgi:2-dehydropantoate 2-reductase
VLVCVKNDALESVARQILPIVGPDTVVLPVMNGVTAAKKLLKILPVGTVPGCVIYTVSGAGADFTITQQGKFTELTVGAQVADPAQQARAVETAAVFTEAGIQCKAVEDVAVAIWTKYVLNCAYNVATARWGCTIGGIKADESRVEDCRALLTESWKVGVASGVALPEELPEKQLRRILKTSDDSDSSLGRDFAAGRAGEMEVFCGDVIRMAAEYGVDVPMTQKYYDALKDIASRF